MFDNVVDGIKWVETRQRFRPKTSLEPMKNAFKLSKLNLDNIKKIQIGGTNGKGSTAAFCSYLGIYNNLKVGTFTSPYLIKFNERIKINMQDISDEDLLDCLNFVCDLNETYMSKYNESLSFFELITLMAFYHFALKEVDLMIIEIGIGGLLDATSVLNYDCNLISSVGFDHMKQLGQSRDEIAVNICGMIKPGNHLISTVDKEIEPWYVFFCLVMGATFLWVDPNTIETISHNPHIIKYQNREFEISLLGSFQKDNAILAYLGFKYLYPDADEHECKLALKNTIWAGRLEQIRPNIFLDGAHNISAIEALVSSAKQLFEGKKIAVIFSTLGDKEAQKMINYLDENVNLLAVCAFNDERFKPLDKLEGVKHYFADFASAYAFVEKSENDIIIITGSIHFIGQVKKGFLANDY